MRRIATRKKREETDRLRKWRFFDSSAELWRVWWRFRGEFCAFKNDYLGRPFDFPFFFQRERFLQLFCCVPFGLPEGDFPVEARRDARDRCGKRDEKEEDVRHASLMRAVGLLK